MYSYDVAITPVVQTLQVTIDMPDRVIGERNLTTATSTKTITYSPAFKATPALGIAANLTTSQVYTISSSTATGFVITANTGDFTFDYVAKGYGKVV